MQGPVSARSAADSVALQDIPKLSTVIADAIAAAPRSGEVWVEAARWFLNPLGGSYNTRMARRALGFARELTAQYGDAFIESLRLHALCLCGFASRDDSLGLAMADPETEALAIEAAARHTIEGAHRICMLDLSIEPQSQLASHAAGFDITKTIGATVPPAAAVHESEVLSPSLSASEALQERLRQSAERALKEPWAVSCQSNYGSMYSICRPLRSSSPKLVLASVWETLSVELPCLAAVYGNASGVGIADACHTIQARMSHSLIDTSL